MRALWEIELAFANVVSTTLTPALGEIRLAWWREQLEQLDRSVAPPAEPRLRAVAAHLIPVGVSGAELSALEDCWLALLAPFPWGAAQADAVAERGRVLFGFSARLLGRKARDGAAMGAIWSLAEAAQFVGDELSREYLSARARLAIRTTARQAVPVELAPLRIIAARRSYDLLHADRSAWHRLLFGLRIVFSRTFPTS